MGRRGGMVVVCAGRDEGVRCWFSQCSSCPPTAEFVGVRLDLRNLIL